jgi:hypothetical protein
MSGDPGDGNEYSEALDHHRDDDPSLTEQPLLSRDTLADLQTDDSEKGPPYAGHAGGAVGGTPAEGRSAGGNIHRGLSPGAGNPGDGTIGRDPEGKRSGKKSAKKRKTR